MYLCVIKHSEVQLICITERQELNVILMGSTSAKKKIGFGRILDLPCKPNLLLLFVTITSVLEAQDKPLVHTPWDHESLNGSIFVTS